MSKQIGLIKLKGTMDGISFYESQGQKLAKMAKGPDKRRILTDARFARTRENNAEFGGSARMCKGLRQTFAPLLSSADTRFTARGLALFKEVNLKSPGKRGRRPFLLSQNTSLFNALEFNINQPVSSLFTGTVNVALSDDRKTGTVAISDVLLQNVLKVPAGATHVVFTQALGVLSDYAYDEQLNRYEPLDVSSHTVSKITKSDKIALNNTAPFSLTIETVLPNDVVLSGDVSVIQCFGIEFLQQTFDDFYALASAMKVVKVS